MATFLPPGLSSRTVRSVRLFEHARVQMSVTASIRGASQVSVLKKSTVSTAKLCETSRFTRVSRLSSPKRERTVRPEPEHKKQLEFATPLRAWRRERRVLAMEGFRVSVVVANNRCCVPGQTLGGLRRATLSEWETWTETRTRSSSSSPQCRWSRLDADVGVNAKTGAASHTATRTTFNIAMNAFCIP